MLNEKTKEVLDKLFKTLEEEQEKLITKEDKIIKEVEDLFLIAKEDFKNKPIQDFNDIMIKSTMCTISHQQEDINYLKKEIKKLKE